MNRLDDDLVNEFELGEEIVGDADDLPADPVADGGDWERDPALGTRLRRGAAILLTGEYAGARYRARDRLVLLLAALAGAVVLATAGSLVLEAFGRGGPAWSLRVAAREAALATFAAVGETAVFLLDHELPTLLAGVTALYALSRRW